MTVSLTRLLDLADRSARKACRGRPDILDDVRQEASINAWKALSSNPEVSEAYIQRCIRNGIANYFNGYLTGGGVGAGNGAAKYNPSLECALSYDMEDKIVGRVDSYPCECQDTISFAEVVISRLKDRTTRDLMYRKYILGEEDCVIREALGLSLNQANIRHRWAKQKIREMLRSYGDKLDGVWEVGFE